MDLNLNFLKQIALNVYDKVHPLLGSKKAAETSQRGAGGDISMYIDLIAEKAVIETLQNARVDLLLISEEIGEKYIGNKETAIKNQNVLIIDPVDGSNNAVRGIPYCCVSIAYAIGKYVSDIKKSVVLDLTTKDLFWATKGGGAFCNGEPIHVSNLDISQKCFFELNLSMRKIDEQLKNLDSIIKRFYRIRVLGSTALTLCHIAQGSLEAFINLRDSNRLVDVAAGLLISREAGGKFFSVDGNNFDQELSIDLKFPFIACNAKLESFLKKELIL